MIESSLGRRPRQTYSAAFKAQLIAEASEPGATVAAVARRHGLNHNLIFKWRREAATAAPTPAPASMFLPVQLTAPSSPAVPSVSQSSASSPPRPAALRITLAGGHILECDGTDRALLDHLLKRLLA